MSHFASSAPHGRIDDGEIVYVHTFCNLLLGLERAEQQWKKYRTFWIPEVYARRTKAKALRFYKPIRRLEGRGYEVWLTKTTNALQGLIVLIIPERLEFRWSRPTPDSVVATDRGWYYREIIPELILRLRAVRTAWLKALEDAKPLW